MKDIEYFKKQQEKAQNEQEKLSAELEKLTANRADLEEQINAAIDSNNFASVEKLTAKQADVDNKITAMERILARKKETSIKREEVSDANNAVMAELQKQFDAACAEIENARNAFMVKMVSAAKIINEAWKKREEFLSFIGDDEPYTLNAGNTDFLFIKNNASLLNLADQDVRILKEKNPEGLQAINAATRPKVNPYFRRK